jgi:hypothetical protein
MKKQFGIFIFELKFCIEIIGHSSKMNCITPFVA